MLPDLLLLVAAMISIDHSKSVRYSVSISSVEFQRHSSSLQHVGGLLLELIRVRKTIIRPVIGDKELSINSCRKILKYLQVLCKSERRTPEAWLAHVHSAPSSLYEGAIHSLNHTESTAVYDNAPSTCAAGSIINFVWHYTLYEVAHVHSLCYRHICIQPGQQMSSREGASITHKATKSFHPNRSC